MSMSVHAWIAAWEDAMHQAGHNKARLDIDMQPFIVLHDGPRFTYSWTPDVDLGVDMNTMFYPDGSWDEAHRCFLAVDHLRPKFVEPSPMLAKMLTQQELDKDS